MLIPVFTLYAAELKGSTPELMGIALGAYGLSQGLLQIPFGLLSDQWGRKPMIAIGLLCFGLGSLLGAWTDHIYGMIAARALQGMGAIGSVLMALAADLTEERERPIAMAIIGATIGLSFMIAFIVSPIVSSHFGLSGIFELSFILVCIGFLVLYGAIPTLKIANPVEKTALFSRFKTLISMPSLLFLNISIFCQHALLTALFFYLPQKLSPLFHAEQLNSAWYFYLPILIGSFVIVFPLIRYTTKKQNVRQGMLVSIALIALTQVVVFSHSLASIGLGLFLYFIAFNFLEAQLPSLIALFAPSHYKGTAMGIYSSFQFLGIFAGGTLAGICFEKMGVMGIFILTCSITSLWFVGAIGISRQHHFERKKSE